MERVLHQRRLALDAAHLAAAGDVELGVGEALEHVYSDEVPLLSNAERQRLVAVVLASSGEYSSGG